MVIYSVRLCRRKVECRTCFAGLLVLVLSLHQVSSLGAGVGFAELAGGVFVNPYIVPPPKKPMLNRYLHTHPCASAPRPSCDAGVFSRPLVSLAPFLDRSRSFRSGETTPGPSTIGTTSLACFCRECTTERTPGHSRWASSTMGVS